MAILTKANILQGINSPKKMKVEALGGELWLRPLSSAEVDEVMRIEAEGIGIINASINKNRSADTNMNLAKMQEKTAEAKYYAVHLSINNPKSKDDWEIDEIMKLPADAVGEMYDFIMKISGAEVTTADVKNFLED